MLVAVIVKEVYLNLVVVAQATAARTKTKQKGIKINSYMLNVEKEDTIDEDENSACGFCGRIGCCMKKCWFIHGRPEGFNAARGGAKPGQGFGQPRCWIFQEVGHISHDYPNGKIGHAKGV